MPAYVIFQGDVHDPVRYEEYKTKIPPLIAPFGGRFLVRGAVPEVLEGKAVATRTVVIEFPDREAALAWYHSPAYAEAIPIRQEAAHTAMLCIIEGSAG